MLNLRCVILLLLSPNRDGSVVQIHRHIGIYSQDETMRYDFVKGKNRKVVMPSRTQTIMSRQKNNFAPPLDKH